MPTTAVLLPCDADTSAPHCLVVKAGVGGQPYMVDGCFGYSGANMTITYAQYAGTALETIV